VFSVENVIKATDIINVKTMKPTKYQIKNMVDRVKKDDRNSG